MNVNSPFCLPAVAVDEKKRHGAETLLHGTVPPPPPAIRQQTRAGFGTNLVPELVHPHGFGTNVVPELVAPHGFGTNVVPELVHPHGFRKRLVPEVVFRENKNTQKQTFLRFFWCGTCVWDRAFHNFWNNLVPELVAPRGFGNNLVPELVPPHGFGTNVVPELVHPHGFRKRLVPIVVFRENENTQKQTCLRFCCAGESIIVSREMCTDRCCMHH